jgi:hypothetical protein
MPESSKKAQNCPTYQNTNAQNIHNAQITHILAMISRPGNNLKFLKNDNFFKFLDAL